MMPIIQVPFIFAAILYRSSVLNAARSPVVVGGGLHRFAVFGLVVANGQCADIARLAFGEGEHDRAQQGDEADHDENGSPSPHGYAYGHEYAQQKRGEGAAGHYQAHCVPAFLGGEPRIHELGYDRFLQSRCAESCDGPNRQGKGVRCSPEQAEADASDRKNGSSCEQANARSYFVGESSPQQGSEVIDSDEKRRYETDLGHGNSQRLLNV